MAGAALVDPSEQCVCAQKAPMYHVIPELCACAVSLTLQSTLSSA